MGRYTNKLNVRLKKDCTGYERALLQTYCTAPEWRNVGMAEEFGTFLRQGNPFYCYPYFRQIRTFWSVFKDSYQAAHKHHSHFKLITSEYMVMNLFVGISTTVGFTALGIFSSLLFPFLKAQNKTKLQKHIGNVVKEYAQFIHKIPFFNYPYLSKLPPLWKAYTQSTTHTLADFITLMTATIQLIVRAAVATPMAWWYNQPQNQAPDHIHLLVKSHKNNNFKQIDREIKPIKTYKRTSKMGIDYYTHLTVPRYEAFSPVLHKLVRKNVQIKKIASQDKIQCTVLINGNHHPYGLKILYSYQNHLNNKKFLAIDVGTRSMKKTLNIIKNKKNLRLVLMHDF